MVGSAAKSSSRAALGTLASSAVLATVTTLLFAAAAHATRTVFSPVADARVAQAHPNQNFGGMGLAARGGKRLVRTYLKFTVTGLSATVTSARLSLVPKDSSNAGFSTHAASSNEWTERGITWENAPAMSAATLGSSGAYACARTCHVNARVTPLITGNGTYTVVISSGSARYDGFKAARRAGATGGPRLIVTTRAEPTTEPPSESGWAAIGPPPRSDAQAAALVKHQPEQRPGNVSANDYVPSAAQLQAFHATANSSNPLNRYVDGLDGLSNPSTDDLIQWASLKWGVPTDWLRAEYVQESGWHQGFCSDRASVSAEWYALYPSFAQLGHDEVNESCGITQIKWRPDNSVGPGTEPLRWQSTAFNIDYQAAAVRFYYDGDCNWCGSGYSAGQEWNSIGAWFSPSPWANSGAQSYIHSVQGYLQTKPWTSPGF